MPNQDTIPTPPWRECKVCLLANLRYGLEDHTLWPQAFVPMYLHLATILCKPKDPNHPLSIMWWNPTMSDFMPCPNSLVEGLGQLSPSRYEAMCKCQHEVDAHVCAYSEALDKLNNLLMNLLQIMKHTSCHMCSLQTPFYEMSFGVTEVQRYFLEVLGLINFLEIYQPRMEGCAPHAMSTVDCFGAFTNNTLYAQQVFDAGLPVYLIQKYDTFAVNDFIILNVVSLLTPTDLVLKESNPSFPVIYQGSTMDHKKHASVHRYFQTWMVYGDPFGDKDNTLDPLIVGQHNSDSASRTVPMSDLLQPQPPVQSTSSQALASLSRSLLASSLSRSLLAPSSSHFLSHSKAAGKSTFLSFLPNTHPVQQSTSHIRK